jgi:hypothetical protein
MTGRGPSDVIVSGLGPFVSGLILHWDGEGWVTNLLGSAQNFFAIGGGNGTVWVGDNNGRSAVNISGYWWADPVSLSSMQPNSIWATGRGAVFAPSTQGTADIAHFDGTSWELQANPGTDVFNDVWGAADDDVFAVGRAIAHYDGSDWTEQVASDGSYTRSRVFGVGGNDVYAVGVSVTTSKLEHYDGSSWSEVLSSDVLNYRDVWASASDDVYVLVETGTGTDIEHWDGSSWAIAESLTGVFLRTIWGSGASDIFAGDSFGKMYHFDGSAWTPVQQFTSVALVEIHGTGPNDVFAIDFLGGIYHFDGNRWDKVNPRTSLSFQSLFATPSTVYLGTSNRTLEILVRSVSP